MHRVFGLVQDLGRLGLKRLQPLHIRQQLAELALPARQFLAIFYQVLLSLAETIPGLLEVFA